MLIRLISARDLSLGIARKVHETKFSSLKRQKGKTDSAAGAYHKQEQVVSERVVSGQTS